MLGKKIRMLREAEGYKQKDFARLHQVDQATLSQIENGHQNPSLALLRSLVKKHNTGYEWLLEEEPESKPNKDRKPKPENTLLQILVQNMLTIMETEGLEQPDFAIRVQMPQKKLHAVLQGREYPEVVELQNMLLAFPEYNANWLLLDRGGMRNKEEQQALGEIIRHNRKLIALLETKLDKNVTFIKDKKTGTHLNN